MGNITKILGGVLIVGGVVLIVWTIFQSYSVFTGKTPAPNIFKAPETQIKTAAPKGNITIDNLEDIQGQLQQVLADQIKGMLPSDVIPKILNLTIWGMLAWILFSGGSHLAVLGIKLLKK